MADKKDKKELPSAVGPIVALDPVALRVYDDMQKAEQEAAATGEKRQEGVLDQILKSIQSNERQRMAFEIDPVKHTDGLGSIYRLKNGLVPDYIIKKITGPQGDDLVCQILQSRSNIMASFGRPRTSRFTIGFQFDEIGGDAVPEDDEAYDALKKRVDHLKDVIWNCGYSGLDDEYFRPNLSQTIKMITRDGLAHGRLAVELISFIDPKTGDKKCHSFRAVDAGTIYRIIPKKESDQSIRQNALRLLQELKNEKFDAQKYERDEYKWVQVVDGKPIQAFSDDELVVYNLYPVTNIEYNGYPLTPIDQALNAIVTHINITLHNKLYFQHGRASRGMLLLKSDDADEGTIQKIRLQFHQSINSVQNSWRMPIFQVGKEDDISWQSIDVSGRDQEFQFLSDNNARVILSAFQMSPEELPGYSHLSRGTNTQALAESDNEWKLVAARDVGLRPLMHDIQDFFNTHIIPRFDKEIAKKFKLVFAGLEEDSPEKESTRIAQDMPLHMTYNDVLERVEKNKLPKEVGGDFPMNPQFAQLVADPYLTVGEKLEFFFGRKGAAKDPRYAYYRDPLWMQWQQILLNKAQISMQNTMMQQQQAAQQQAAMNGEQPEGDGQEQEQQGEQIEKTEAPIEQNFQLLEKTLRDNHSVISKMILARHKEITEKTMAKWKDESKAALKKIKDALKDGDE